MSHFENKNMNDFWKTWEKKIAKISESDIHINGVSDPVTVSNAFVNHFESVYYDSYANDEIRQEYEDCLESALSTEMQAIMISLSMFQA